MKNAFVTALLVLMAIPLLIGVTALPPHGSADAPMHTHVSARYVERGEEEAGAANLVTGVLLNYRSLDTVGEVTVIFTALVAVLGVLISFPAAPKPPDAAGAAGTARATDHAAPTQPQVSPVVGFVVRLLAPFIALFTIYVIVHGHVSPGGGFQGGAILGGLFIALTTVLGENRTRCLLPRRGAPWMRGAALLAFVAAGVIGAVLTGYFLGYPAETNHLATELMLLGIEIGIGLGGAAIFATIFLQMEEE